MSTTAPDTREVTPVGGEGPTIPLIIRGKVIDDHLLSFGGRRGAFAFRAPDVNHYLSEIVCDPASLRDLYAISFEEILDYLEELAERLSPHSNPHIARALEMSLSVSGQSPEVLRTMYAGMPSLLRRPRVRDLVEHNIGSEYLEGWVPSERSDRSVDIRAFGARTLHINAGNGIGVAAEAVVANAVLRSDAIVKSPSNDPFTAAALALTMIDMAPDHPLTKHMTVAYWKGGDESFERRFYNPSNIEKIVAWGGAASMGHIRRHLGPGLDLVALDPKWGRSIIGREAFASDESMRTAAGMLARDVGHFNQEGCANSRVAYAISGTGPEDLERLNRFGELVYEAIQQLPPELSGEHPFFDPVLRDEIAGISLSPAFNVVGGKGAEGAVIVSQDDEPVDFSDRLGCRVVNIVPFDDVQEIYRYLTVHTQTLSVYPDALKQEIRDEAGRRGVQRVTELGFAASVSMAQPHDGMELLRRMARWIVTERYVDHSRHGSGIAFGDL